MKDHIENAIVNAIGDLGVKLDNIDKRLEKLKSVLERLKKVWKKVIKTPVT